MPMLYPEPADQEAVPRGQGSRGDLIMFIFIAATRHISAVDCLILGQYWEP